jgi:hypothetical protein
MRNPTVPNSSDSTRASNWFKGENPEHALSEMLDAAEENATTEWEETFVDDFQFKVSRWGLNTYMSENQYNSLKRIAEKESA